MTIQGFCQLASISRQKIGFTEEQVADCAGVSPARYRDLEVFETDWTMTISTQTLLQLCECLRIPVTAVLYEEGDVVNREHRTAQELRDSVEAYLRVQSLSVEQFEELVGWEVGLFLENPEKGVLHWNLDCLKDVCSPLSLNYREYVPVGLTNVEGSIL